MKGNCNDTTSDNVNVIIGCTKIELFSPKGTIDITKISDCAYQLQLAGNSEDIATVVAQDGSTTVASGNGTQTSPVIAEVKLADLPTNALSISEQGLFAQGLAVAGASSGTSVSAGNARLGSAVGSNVATLLSDREIPMAGFNLLLSGTGRWGIGTTTPATALEVTGVIKSSSLAGTGVRMVVTDPNGILGTQVIPTYIPAEKVFYVAKKYTGPGAAVVTGTTLASISSTNTSYMTQLNAAQMGSLEKTYPDPWSARNAAMDAILAGTIQMGYIVVLADNRYTVGSDNNAQNGTITSPYATSGDEVSDVCFNSTNGFSAVASLIQNNVYIEFRETSGLYYICHSFNVFLGYVYDGAVDAKFMGGILGKGFFHRLYGFVNGFTDLILVVDNANAVVEFSAKEVSLQGDRGFVFQNVAEAYINIDYIYVGDIVLLHLHSFRATTLFAKTSNITFKAKSVNIGYYQSLYPDLETSSLNSTKFRQGVNLYPRTVNIEIDTFNMYMNGNDMSMMNMDYNSYPSGYTGNTDVRHITDLVYQMRILTYKEIPRASVTTTNMLPSMRFMLASRNQTIGAGATITNLANRNKILIEYKHANLLSPLLTGNFGIRTEGVDNIFIFRSDKMIKDNVSCTRTMFDLQYTVGGPGNQTQIVFEGFFEDKQNHLFQSVTGNTGGGTCRITLRGRFLAMAAGKAIIWDVQSTPVNSVNFILDGAILVNDGVTFIINTAQAGNEILCLGAVANSHPNGSFLGRGNSLLIDEPFVGTFY